MGVQTDNMAKKMLIDATHAEETRVVLVDGNKVEEFDFESENKRQLAGNIYLAKVTRVEPSLQAAFVDYGGNRHGFLAFSEIHPDYYQIPVADREALMAEERAYAEAMSAKDDDVEKPKSRSRRRRSSSKAAKTDTKDVSVTKDVAADISGMETIDLTGDDEEGLSPMETVAETPVEEPISSEEATTAEETPVVDAADATEETPVAEEAPAVEETAAVEEAPAGEEAAEAPSVEEAAAEETPVVEETTAEETPAADSDDESEEPEARAATAKDESIESVSDHHDSDEDIRPQRKPRPRRYKIQEVIKVRQILLVQVVKEERGNKGAALTTYLSLAGRYCVLMPNTARGGGISRKITNAADRKKLKEIANGIDVPQGAGLIIRTAGAERTKTEIKRDYEYLQRLWEQIRALTLESIAPAKIYEEGDLIKRTIRDLYNREIEEVLVEGERGYRNAKDFMKMIMPSHAKNVKNYIDPMPLFARYQVESYLSSMFNPTVQLKSGGYIVIGVTEALVAIDVNSGRATKENSIEETALKTNLEASEEVARQLRLRDLAGLIVIDYIDMDERKNNAAVEKRLKDKLKSDRARIQVGRISGFGLLEMSRQRLRPGMIEATTQPCPSCHGTGLIRSDDNMALSILREIEEEGVRRRSREVLVKCPVDIANYLMNQKREHVAQIEARYGLSVRIEGDVHLVSPDFSLEKLKTATRVVAEVAAPVVSVDTTLMDEIDDEDVVAVEPEEAVVSDEDENKPKKRRRRRRRRKSNGEGQEDASSNDTESDTDNGDAQPTEDASGSEADAPAADAEKPEGEAEAPKKRRRRSRRKKTDTEEGAATESTAAEGDAPAVAADAVAEVAEAVAEEKPKPKRTRSRSRTAKPAEAVAAEVLVSEPAVEVVAEAVAADAPADTASEAPVVAEAAVETPVEAAVEAPVETVAETVVEAEPVAEPVAEAVAEASNGAVAPEPVAETPVDPAPEPQPEPEVVEAEAEDSNKPKKRGWWSIAR